MADFVPVPSPLAHLQPDAWVQIAKDRLGDLVKNSQGLVVVLQERLPVMVQELASLVKEDLHKGQAESILVRVVFYISSFIMLLTILQTRWFRWIWNFESDYKKKCKRANEIKETEKKKQGQNEEEDEFAKIHYSLKSDLQHCVQIRIEAVKMKIAAQKKKLQEKVDAAEAEKDREIEVFRAKYAAEEEAVLKSCQQKVTTLEADYRAEVENMRESVKELRVILSSGSEEGAVMEQSKSELECPVCFEEMRPPKRIWQCSDGHPVCEACRRKPEVTVCPTCRKYIVGRSTIAEKLARALYRDEEAGGPQDKKPRNSV